MAWCVLITVPTNTRYEWKDLAVCISDSEDELAKFIAERQSETIWPMRVGCTNKTKPDKMPKATK